MPSQPLKVVVREVSALPGDVFSVHICGTSPDGNPVPVTVQSPFTTETEDNDLNWYCEAADREPFSVSHRLRRVEKSLHDYGTRLFNSLFSKPSTKLPEKRFVIIRIIGSYRFASLHWELLRDPVRGPVGLDSSRCVVRDVIAADELRSNPAPHPIISYPTLNVLFLTARQRIDERDIPLRVESLAVLDTVRDHNLPLRFDLVRPGTLPALEEKLDQKRRGFYHVLHLDCHGTDGMLNPFNQPHQEESNKLLLETERGSHVAVSASEIARLADKYHIPIVFTSACRAGKTTARAPSFAYDLFSRSRVQCVVVMALSVLVDTTARFVKEFYLAMLNKDGARSVSVATDIARRALRKDCKRNGILGTILRQDWWIPQLFAREANGKDIADCFLPCTWEEAALRLPSPDERALIWQENEEYAMRKTLLVYDAIDPKKFVGRDEDLRMLETKVFSHDRRDNVLLLYGMMGVGKTAFLTYVSWWWCVTGLVRDKFVFRLHERQFTRNDMVWHIYRQLFNVMNYDPTNASESQIEEDRKRVTEHLRKNCYVVVIDSAERLCSPQLEKNGHHRSSSVASQGGSDFGSDTEDNQHANRKPTVIDIREEIAKWLAELQGGKTIVLVGSRGSHQSLLMKHIENTSNMLDFATILVKYPSRHIDLLRPEWSKVLVKQILDLDDDNSDPRYTPLYTYPMLDLYGGNPLVINLVVGSFKASDSAKIPHPEELSEKLQRYLIRPSTPMDVFASIEYSFNLLSAPQQEALLFLAPFKCSVTSRGLNHYADALENNSPSCPKFDREAWDSAIRMAVRWGLLTIHERVKRQRGRQAWRIHACLSPLLIRKLAQRLNLSTSAGLSDDLAPNRLSTGADSVDKDIILRPMLRSMHVAYWKWALQLYDMLRDADKEKHDAGKVMTEIDFWNLNRMLKYALEEKVAFYAIILPVYWFLETRNDIAHRYRLCRKVIEKIGMFERLADIPGSNQIYRMDVPRMYHIFGMLLGHHRLNKLDEAEALFIRTKRIWEENGNHDEMAVTEHELGWVAMNKKDYFSAKKHYNKALELSNRLDRSRTLHNMGLLAAFEAKFEAARRHHEEAKELYEEQGDERAIASAYHHMAIVTARVHEYDDAEEFANTALATRERREETEQTANVYQLRGNIALRRARSQGSRKEALVCLNKAKKEYDRAMLTYNCASGFHYGVIPKREMLHENYGLLMAVQRQFTQDEEQQHVLLRTEMDSYIRVKYGPYPKSLFNLGLLHEELGQQEEAFQCFDAASRLTPDSTRDTLDREARDRAMTAKARCLATGKGVIKDEHAALTEMLRLRGEIGDEDPLESLALPQGSF